MEQLALLLDGEGPDWLVLNRVLGTFELAKGGRGCRAYVAWLEARSDAGGEVREVAIKELRRGWNMGEPTFADKLRSLVGGNMDRGRDGRDEAARGHDESEAEDPARRAMEMTELAPEVEKLAELRNGDARKVLVAVLVRKHTSVRNRWLADRLAMGHTAGVSRLQGTFHLDRGNLDSLTYLEEMLQ